MSLITASNISKSFGAEDVFIGISISIPQKSRIGLVGPNGVGKTTLLKILVDEERPGQGQVMRAKNLRIGYLPQETLFYSNQTLWEECLGAMRDMLTLQERLREIESQMQQDTENNKLLDQYGVLQERFERLGGYTYEVEIKKVLGGLGFTEGEWNRPIKQFSGGERTRAYLARLLLAEPQLLLLDEPTNHLDMQAIEWLEEYLKEFPGAVVAVSHDRFFLDQVVDTVWEMTPDLVVYRGNYSAFMSQREERYRRLLKEYSAQQEFIKKEEDYIQRNIAGQNTRQAQGRRKRLERLLEEARITLPSKQRSMHMHLVDAKRSGDMVLSTKDLVIGYPDDRKPLFRSPDIYIHRGDCAAILGPNGAGKTTFLKTILGELVPLEGSVRLGANVRVGYFAQAHGNLHSEWTLMQEIQALDPKILPKEVKDHLGSFRFSGDDVEKRVAGLSGGERGRLALACLVLQKANLLFLDEPSNHLDLPSQEILQSALADFAGTILLVTHDRYLVDALATQIWEVEPMSRTLNVFEGGYSKYKEFLQSQRLSMKTSLKKKDQKKHKRKKGSKINPQLQAQIEAEIYQIEEQMKYVENMLKVTNDPEKVGKLGKEYLELHNLLDSKLKEWDNLV